MDILQPWGKTGPNSTFHPALFHMLDVGNVARVLLEPSATPRFRWVLSRALNVADTESLVRWLPLIVSMHDIGKVSSPFQGKVVTPRREQRVSDSSGPGLSSAGRTGKYIGTN